MVVTSHQSPQASSRGGGGARSRGKESNYLKKYILSLAVFLDYPKYYQLKHQQLTTKVEDVQALLDDSTVLIEYLISESY